MKSIVALVLSLLLTTPAFAGVIVQENFDAQSPGANVLSFGPGWITNTFGWTVGNTPGAAYSGTQYLDAPSRVGRLRVAYFDATAGFNARPAGQNVVISDVRIYVPLVVDATFGGLFLYDQSGAPIGVLGVDMTSGMSASSATQEVHNFAINLGAYNNLEIITDFVTGSIQYLLDGINVGNGVMTASNLANGFGQAAMYENGLHGTVPVGFRFDDYQVRTVSEPRGLSLLLLGVVFVISRKLRRPFQS